MAIRNLISHPCGFRANPPPEVAELHDVGIDLCIDFTLPEGNDSITHTLRVKTLMPMTGVCLVDQTYPLFRSIRKLQYRLCINFDLHERSRSIIHTPSWQDIHVDEGCLPCKQIHPLFHSIKCTSTRAVGATDGIGIMHTTPAVAL
jgi:hypothetical protein